MATTSMLEAIDEMMPKMPNTLLLITMIGIEPEMSMFSENPIEYLMHSQEQLKKHYKQDFLIMLKNQR